jgi:hypothetical protein
VVDVAVGQQDGHGFQPVLAKDVVDTGGNVDSGIHDDALLTRAWCDDVDIGAERRRGEASDQHALSSRSS